ncbi:hypothetical protein F5880DRAFT_1568647 [Lentinula raphanica]|nr:hypothetical protein F5880DRAFT_1568647 [Lentinula raphanica]
MIIMQFHRRTLLKVEFVIQLGAMLFKSINIERLQIYLLGNLPPGQYALCVKNALPKCLTSLTLGFPWYTMRTRFFEALLAPLTSLEHFSLLCDGTEYSIDIEVTLPNLVSYHGPSLFLKSLAQGSKKLSSLILEVFTPSHFTETRSENQTLKHLREFGSKDECGPDAAVLSFLKIVCDAPEAVNAALEFIPQVEHLSLLCTSTEWITPERLPSLTWHGPFKLDFLSRTPSIRKFSLHYVHSKQSLPWDMAQIATSLGEMNESLVEVNIYGNNWRGVMR